MKFRALVGDINKRRGWASIGDFRKLVKAGIYRFCMLVKNGESRDLANAMKKLLDDLNLHEEFCCAARSVQESHPNLAQVAEQWLRAGSAQ